MPREVLLTGSVPREPASEVFRLATDYLGPFLTRIPDGEQGGWGGANDLLAAVEKDTLLEPGPQAKMTNSDTPFGAIPPITLRKLRAGVRPEDFIFPATGVGAIKINSYQEFRQMKDAGDIPQGVCFQATLPGPVTTGGTLYMPLDVGARAVGKAIIAEISQLLDAIPHEDLAIQFDLAVEVESEEMRRRPGAFNTPLFKHMFDGWGDWGMDDLVDEVVRVASVVPADVELGFHLCGTWHLDHRGGQDLNVHVDWANALTERIDRPIGYIHMASVPEHGRSDYASLERLKLDAGTKLFLGLIHGSDGLEGARRRVEAAAEFRSDFGVAHFCGLNPIFEVDPARLDDMLDLHRQVASL
jgi:hypothetical protein